MKARQNNKYVVVQVWGQILSIKHADKTELQVKRLTTQRFMQGRNHGEMLPATSAMVGKICPPWLGSRGLFTS